MQILLLRHGETDWNLQGRCQGATDLDLSEIGIQQAKEVAVYLSEERVDAVYSSKLKRALQTASAVSQPHDLAVTIEDNFRELHHGEFEGLTFPEIRATYPEFISMWRSKPADLLIPGGERIVDVERRAWRGMERIIRSHLPHERVVVATHNFPILAILCRITGTPLDEHRSFHVDPCGVSRVSYNRKDGWKIVQINDRGYTVVPR